MPQRNFCEKCELTYVNAGPGQWCLACDGELGDEFAPVRGAVPTSALTSCDPIGSNWLVSELYARFTG